jgi:3-phosphoshikimate 1-carboxyvinyltransferase
MWRAPTAVRSVAVTTRLPGSKSMMARALVLSAISHGASTLRSPLRVRDTELMAAGLRAIGAHVSTMDEDQWVVRPRPMTGPACVDAGPAGTVLRFLPPIAALCDGPIHVDGGHGRPMAPLIGALRSLGVRIETQSGTDALPFTIHGIGHVAGGEITIDASASSQFVSGLLLAGTEYDRGIVVRHVGPPLPHAPHVSMTVAMLRAAGGGVDDSTPDLWVVEPGELNGRGWDIEPDLTAAAPFLAAALVTGGTVRVPGWPQRSAQGGDRLRELLGRMGGDLSLRHDGLTIRGSGVIHGINADLSSVSDLTTIIAALAVLADSPSCLRGIGHIHHHETDRLAILARELTHLGASVSELPDGLMIRPRPLSGGVFTTYGDHRMAHAGAVLGLAVPGVELSDVTCTAKTMPEFIELWTAMVRGADGTSANPRAA